MNAACFGIRQTLQNTSFASWEFDAMFLKEKFEIDRNVSLDPAENEDIAVCLEELRCLLLDEKISGSRFIYGSKKVYR